jgi:hypothetical protein
MTSSNAGVMLEYHHGLGAGATRCPSNGGASLKTICLHADEAGESHWRESEIELSERLFAPPAQKIFISNVEPVTNFVFLKLKTGWDEPIHPSPRRQTLIALRGRVEVTASDGEVRHISPGDVWRMEDTQGKGHHTRVVSDEDFEAAVVQFE